MISEIVIKCAHVFVSIIVLTVNISLLWYNGDPDIELSEVFFHFNFTDSVLLYNVLIITENLICFFLLICYSLIKEFGVNVT